MEKKLKSIGIAFFLSLTTFFLSDCMEEEPADAIVYEAALSFERVFTRKENDTSGIGQEEETRISEEVRKLRQEKLDRGLFGAVISGGRDDVLLYLCQGASLETRDNGGMLPIHWVALRGDIEIIEVLFLYASHHYQENIDAMGPNNWQPIHWAAHAGQLRMVQWLVEHGADCNAKTVHGQRPVDLARARAQPYVKVSDWLGQQKN